MPPDTTVRAKPYAPGLPRSFKARPWWPWVKRVVAWTFLALVAWLIVRYARTLDWDDVLASVRALPRASVATAMGLAACSFVVYSTYDLLGRRMTGHRLGVGTTMGITFVCYAFNLNLGSLVGGVALRYRLYSRLGLDNDTITRVLGFSMLTNWFGYLVIAGAAFWFGSIGLPPGWRIDTGQLRVVGALLLAVGAAYLVACAVFGERVWRIGRHAIETPSIRMALLQLGVSTTNWALMGAVVWTLLQHQASYPQVLAVLLLAAVAGVITHVPAGLGVLEAVFVALLSHAIPEGRLIGALLAYRAVYYLVPLAVATLFYVVTEVRGRKLRTASDP